MSEKFFEWDEFLSLKRVEQALVLIWESELQTGEVGLPIPALVDRFVAVGLPHQNPGRLEENLRAHRETRKLKGNRYSLTTNGRKRISETFSKAFTSAHQTSPEQLERPPFIEDALYERLPEMAELYARVFLLENSLRGLIEHRLKANLGQEWWTEAANASMKKKHAERLKKEEDNKWAPARGELGPLYALDWSDLITLVRKYEACFLDIIGSVQFMHRFEDLGMLRNVVAHNGVVSDETHFVRMKLYFDDWISQTRVAGS